MQLGQFAAADLRIVQLTLGQQVVVQAVDAFVKIKEYTFQAS